MISETAEINWEDILSKFSLYKGTIRNFCKENNISIHQLYYRRKKPQKKANCVFHAVSLENENSKKTDLEKANLSYSHQAESIRIEIGKANIYIQNNDTSSLSNTLKVILETC